MQINRIEVELGATVNTGDFQSIKSAIRLTADIDRGEDPMEAHGKLIAFAKEALVNAARDSHPDAVRKLIAHDVRDNQAIAGNVAAAETTKGKPGRKPKAAEQAAAPVTPPAETPKLADTPEGMSIGGLDKEPGAAVVEDDLSDLDDLVNGVAETVEEPVTKEQCQAAMVALSKASKSKAAVVQLLSKFGVGNLTMLPETKLAAFKAAADAETAKYAAAG